jgi:hypothetical protein
MPSIDQDTEATMVRRNTTAGRDAVGPKSESPLVTLRDQDLIAAAGGATFLTSSLSDAIKAIGEGLSTVARKG